MQMATVQWFIKCGLTAAVLLLACGLATARFGHGLQLPSTTTRDGSLITLNRYATEPIPDVVLLGSSLTFRLKEEYFATTKLRNLALAGGSPVTGLEIVANQPRLPKIILVETNVLSRATDEVLVGRYSSKGNAEPLFFRPVRTVGCRLRKLAACTRNPCAGCFRACPVAPAAAQRFRQSHLCRSCGARGQHRGPDGCNADQRSKTPAVDPALEQRGARVLLFQLPLAQELENAGFARTTGEYRSWPISRFRSLAADRRRAQRVAVGRRCSSG